MGRTKDEVIDGCRHDRSEGWVFGTLVESGKCTATGVIRVHLEATTMTAHRFGWLCLIVIADST